MREQPTDFGKLAGAPKLLLPKGVETVWQSRQVTCGQCLFKDQDIDTSPCANCHTRN